MKSTNLPISVVFSHACAVQPSANDRHKTKSRKIEKSNIEFQISSIRCQYQPPIYGSNFNKPHAMQQLSNLPASAGAERILWSGAQVLFESHIWSELWRWRYAELVLENRFGLLKVFLCGSLGYFHSALEETNRLIASFVCACVCAWPIAFHLELPFSLHSTRAPFVTETQTVIFAAMHFLWSDSLSQCQKSWKCNRV